MIQIATLEQILAAQTNFLGTLNENLNALMNRQYAYTHDEIVTGSLEMDYQAILTADAALTVPAGLANASAVGLLAILKNGDTISTQGNRLFINGSEEANGYTFSGTNSQGGVELVKIWYFENGGSLTLQNPGVNVIKAISKTISATPSLSNDFYDYADEIEYSTAPSAAPVGVRKQKNLSSGNLNDYVSNTVEEYYSNCTTIPANNGTITSKTNLKAVNMPYLTTIASPSTGTTHCFGGCTSLEAFYFPSLTTINSCSVQSATPFKNVKGITLPASVTTVGKWTFTGNSKIILNCKDAAFDNDWYYGTAPATFSMCGDWGASINISVTASSWAMADYIDLMTNKLRDMTLTSETRTLKISSAMLASLQADTDGAAAISAATSKGWTIGA